MCIFGQPEEARVAGALFIGQKRMLVNIRAYVTRAPTCAMRASCVPCIACNTRCCRRYIVRARCCLGNEQRQQASSGVNINARGTENRVCVDKDRHTRHKRVLFPALRRRRQFKELPFRSHSSGCPPATLYTITCFRELRAYMPSARAALRPRIFVYKQPVNSPSRAFVLFRVH